MILFLKMGYFFGRKLDLVKYFGGEGKRQNILENKLIIGKNKND